jgi:putative transposase
MSFSSYYYKPKPGRKGRLPSCFSVHLEKGKVSQAEVVAEIKALLAAEEFLDCGYHLMSAYLKDKGYLINHKKLYRIMKEAGLLKADARIKRSGSGRKFVAFRKVETTRPLECVEMDIKMVWLPDRGKNAYLLTLLDVHTRKVLGYKFALSIKQKQVIDLCERLIGLGLLPEGGDHPQ